MQPLVVPHADSMPPLPVSASAPGADGQVMVVPMLDDGHALGSWAFR